MSVSSLATTSISPTPPPPRTHRDVEGSNSDDEDDEWHDATDSPSDDVQEVGSRISPTPVDSATREQPLKVRT